MKRMPLLVTVVTGLISAAAAQVGDSVDTVIRVMDQTGASIQNAHVKVLRVSSTVGKDLTTDGEGKVSLDLPSGAYDVNVKSPGFRSMTQRIQVKPEARPIVDFVLQVGSCEPCLALSDSVSFPSQSQAISPDERYAVLNVDSESAPHHALFLQDRQLKHRRKLFDYARHVVVMWNSDSRIFAVTDYSGGDGAQCGIFSVDDNGPPMKPVDLLVRQLQEEARKSLQAHLRQDHVYVEAFTWDGSSLELKVSRNSDANSKGFTEFYNLLLPAHDTEKLPR